MIASRLIISNKKQEAIAQGCAYPCRRTSAGSSGVNTVVIALDMLMDIRVPQREGNMV